VSIGESKRLTITREGILEGEQYLRDHSSEFDYGAAGMHARFIKELIQAVLRVSHIEVEMPD
jgi:hypothetical protein